MSKISVGKPSTPNLAQVHAIAEEIFAPEYARSRTLSHAFFEEILSSYFIRMYVAKQNDSIEGFAIYKAQGMTETHELFQIGVRKSSQGKGIGKVLLTESMGQYAKEMNKAGIGVYAIYLATAFDNPVAQRLYHKCGFEVTGTLSDSYAGMGDRQILMTKIFDRNRKYEPGTLWTPEKKE